MDDLDSKALKETLDAACTEALKSDYKTAHTIGSKIRVQGVQRDNQGYALIEAFDYMLQTEEARRRDFGPFAPMIETTGGNYPIPPEQQDPNVLDIWEWALNQAPLPVARARFADLLWTAKRGPQPYKFALRAIKEYLQVRGSGYYEPLDLSDNLQRALELAKKIGDQRLAEQVIESMVDLTREALASERPIAGVSLRLIDALAKLKKAKRPAELEGLLNEATRIYGDDARILESCLTIRLRLTPASEHAELGRQMAEAYRSLARENTGLLKYAHLQKSIEIADKYGLRPLADDISQEVQDIPKEELEFETIEAEVEIPREVVNEFIDSIVGADEIDAALMRFGAYMPARALHGDSGSIGKETEEYQISRLFGRMIMDSDNNLIKSIDDPEAQEEQALIDELNWEVSTFAPFAVRIIDALQEKYGPISSADNWFQSDFIESTVASRIKKGIEHYESGDYDSAASVLAPRLERIIRRMATAAGLPTTRSPEANGRTGGVKALGELLSLLKGSLPEDTRQYLRVLLSEATGLNIRNRVGHGLVEDVPQHEAALLIHACCHLQGFGVRPEAWDAQSGEGMS